MSSEAKNGRRKVEAIVRLVQPSYRYTCSRHHPDRMRRDSEETSMISAGIRESASRAAFRDRRFQGITNSPVREADLRPLGLLPDRRPTGSYSIRGLRGQTDKDLSNPYLSAKFVIDFARARSHVPSSSTSPTPRLLTAQRQLRRRSLWQHHQHHNRSSRLATSNRLQQVTE
jgi:hypothetical protein